MADSTLGLDARLAHDAIVRDCSAGLSARELLVRVSARLKPVVPFAAAGWLSTDPATLLYTDAVTEGVDSAAHERLFENELLEQDFAKFTRMLDSGRPVATLWEATDGQPSLSPRYEHIYRSLGLESELRAVLASAGTCWGVACLTRRQGDPGFSKAEVEYVASITEHLAHGLRMALLLREVEEAPADEAPGTIILGPDGSLESITESAEGWLSLLPPEYPAEESVLPSAIQAVAIRARGTGDEHAGAVPRARLRLRSGQWLTVHAAELRGPEPRRTAIVIEPARRAELTALVVQIYELTQRERQVTELMVRGLPIDEIAEGLWLSHHTVRDHVKAIYGKLGVSSRPELTAKLAAEHFQPTS